MPWRSNPPGGGVVSSEFHRIKRPAAAPTSPTVRSGEQRARQDVRRRVAPIPRRSKSVVGWVALIPRRSTALSDGSHPSRDAVHSGQDGSHPSPPPRPCAPRGARPIEVENSVRGITGTHLPPLRAGLRRHRSPSSGADRASVRARPPRRARSAAPTGAPFERSPSARVWPPKPASRIVAPVSRVT